MVQCEALVDKLSVTADGTGLVRHAGSVLVAGVADRVGLTRALSAAMAPSRERRSAHDPGVVLRDLASIGARTGRRTEDPEEVAPNAARAGFGLDRGDLQRGAPEQ
jgi:hypothetical protein